MTNLSKKDLAIIEKLKAKKEFQKNAYYENYDNSIKHFVSDAKTYIKAIKENRMLCIIKSVSSSGMSRVISFHSFEKNYYRQYFCFFKTLGYSEVNEGFRIHGCGMDMIFNTNYNIIHKLHRLRLISKKECDILCQKTPTKF